LATIHYYCAWLVVALRTLVFSYKNKYKNLWNFVYRIAGFIILSLQTLAASLDAAVRAEDPYFNKLVRIMATRCMTQAVYFSSGEYSVPEYYHYGLAAPLYTHFTSPIRRYADVVVHSFHAVKVITTGEGGCLSTNNANIYNKVLRLRSHGVIRNNKLKSKFGSCILFYTGN